VDVVEVVLGDGGEALLLRGHVVYTPQRRLYVTGV
jgi:hypothetical protein